MEKYFRTLFHTEGISRVHRQARSTLFRPAMPMANTTKNVVDLRTRDIAGSSFGDTRAASGGVLWGGRGEQQLLALYSHL